MKVETKPYPSLCYGSLDRFLGNRHNPKLRKCNDLVGRIRQSGTKCKNWNSVVGQ